MSRVVSILSGGLDSSVLAYVLKPSPETELHLLSFDYGQRHRRELDSAAQIAEFLESEHHIVNLRSIKGLLGGSALTDNVEVPHGHYAAESMAATVVPNRNAIMLSIAYGYAVSLNAEAVAFGVHSGDHFIYPDCRPGFVKALDLAFSFGNEGFGNPELELVAPFLHLKKEDIVSIGSTLGVPMGYTWSCYEGGDKHCGRCGTCVERKEAFRLAKVVDPTDYADPYYEVEAYRAELAKES